MFAKEIPGSKTNTVRIWWQKSFTSPTVAQPAQQECTLGTQMLTFVKKIHRARRSDHVCAWVAQLLNPRERSLLPWVRSLSCCRNEDIKGASRLHQVLRGFLFPAIHVLSQNPRTKMPKYLLFIFYVWHAKDIYYFVCYKKVL